MVRPSWLWLFDCFLVDGDFDNKDYMEGSILICRITKGGFTKEYIDTLPYDEFMELNKFCGEIQDKENNG